MIEPLQAAEHVRKSVMLAAKTYERWTGGAWLWDSGCESLMVATAGRRFAQANVAGNHGVVTLETPLSAVRDSLKIAPRGRIRKAIANGKRADIALWSRTDRPYGVIEIKRSQDLALWQSDLEELVSLLEVYGLRAGGAVRFGIVGGWVARKGRKRLQTAVDALREKTDTLCRGRVCPRLEAGPRRHWDPSDRTEEHVYQAVTVTVTHL